MKRFLIILSVAINVLFCFAIVRHFVLLPKSVKPTHITYWLNRDELFKQLLIDSNSIVFAGDSHIENFEVTEIFNSLHIKNRGINYDTSKGLLNRLDDLLTAKPKKIFIEIGTNDIVTGIPAKETLNNVEKSILLIHAKTPGTQIFILGVLYTHAQVQPLNYALSKLANKRNATYVNLSSINDGGGLKKIYNSGDGIHLNGKGYLRLSEILTPFLRK